MTIKSNRRSFLQKSGLALMGAGFAKASLSKPEQELADGKPRIKDYRTFGATGFKVSDFGCGAPPNEAVLRALLDAGVNFIDTAHQYGNGNNERLIGKVLKDYDRSKIFVTTKIYEPGPYKSKEDIVKRTNEALERLDMEYVDALQIHSAENSRIIKDENWHAAVAELKADGKVKYNGLSCHGSMWYQDPEENMEKVLMTAIEDGRFEFILMAYNFFNADMAERILEACHEAGIAVAIMKSNPVKIFQSLSARKAGLDKEGKEPSEYLKGYLVRYEKMHEQAVAFFGQYGIQGDADLRSAASRFVLSNPNIHTICYGFANFTDIDQLIPLSGQRLTERDTALLEQYKHYMGPLNCRIGCNACEAACPHHVPVNTIARYQYYFQVKGQEKYAMEQYNKLPKELLNQCNECPGFCENACPHGVLTRGLLTQARADLRFLSS